MIRYMDEGCWLDAQNIEQICTLFTGVSEFMTGRTKPISLLDGRVIDRNNAHTILLECGLQRHLDSQAMCLGYDNMQSAMVRAGYPGPYHAEGTKLAQWADSCWVGAYAIFADIKARKCDVPTIEELIAALPVFG